MATYTPTLAGLVAWRCGGFSAVLVGLGSALFVVRHTRTQEGTGRFELQAQGQETRLDFTQSDIPEDLYAELETGWVEYYWDNLAAYFG
ncbi:MAG: SRPBCC domain-containing protein [Halobacteriota archaeon]